MERKTITINEEIARVLTVAATVWPELAHNQSMLIGKIIADWHRSRADSGSKSQKINVRLDQHGIMLQMIMVRLGIVPIQLDYTNCDNQPDEVRP